MTSRIISADSHIVEPADFWTAYIDKRYADRADFAFGSYRYFPARGRAAFLSVDYASY